MSAPLPERPVSGTDSAADTAFVVGPGRSGTTLLYKLLCMHPEVAYLSNLENHLPWLPAQITARIRVESYAGKLRYWFLKGGNAYLADRRFLQKFVPTPVEGEAFYRFHGLPAATAPDRDPGERAAGALNGAFSRLRDVSGKKLFISKRTANNRRLPILDAIFPQAKYISLKRDGRDVAASLSNVGWWAEHNLWWDPQNRTPREVNALGEDMLRLCARNWVAETEVIEQGLSRIESKRVMDLQFERLVDAPVAEMRRLLDYLDLPSTQEYERAITALNLGCRPGIRHSTWSAEQLDMVNREQGPLLKRQGYGV